MSTTKPASIKRNVLSTVVGNAFYAASQWLLLIVLAKLGGTGNVGLFSLAMAINAPVLVLTKLQLRDVQVTDAKEEYSFDHYLGLRIACSMLMFVIVIPLAIASSDNGKQLAVILILTAAKAIEMLSDIFYGLFQKHERMDFVSLSLIVRGSCSLLIFSLLLLWTDQLLWGSIGLAVVWGLLLLLLDVRLALHIMKSHHARFDWKSMFVNGVTSIFRDKKMLRLFLIAIPMGLAGVFNTLSENIPRYVIQHELGEHALGIFAAVAYLIIAGDTIIVAFGQTITPRLAKYYAAEKTKLFVKLLLQSLAATACIGFAGLAVAFWGGSFLLPLLYNDDFIQHGNLFVWLMINGTLAFVCNIMGAGITAMRKFKIQVPIQLISCILMIVLCPIFLRHFGLVGVPMAMAIKSLIANIAYAGIVVYSIVKLKKRENFTFPETMREVQKG